MFGFNPREHPSLPQNDSSRGQRKRADQIADARTEYVWDASVPNAMGVPLSKSVPRDDKPTISWLLTVLDVALEIVENTLRDLVDDDSDDVARELASIREQRDAVRRSQADREEVSIGSWLEDKLSDAKRLLSTDVGSLTEQLTRLQRIVEDHPLPAELLAQDGLAPYKGLFESIRLNPLAEDFQLDSEFAYYRVAGPNPMLIECIQALPANFPVTEEGFVSVMGAGDSLSVALSERRAFLIDYKEIVPITENTGEWDGLPKQLFAPLALLVRAKDSESLVPVAIQRSQAAADHPIVYAKEGWRWETAKSIVEMAEGNYHELFVHLGRTHLFIEAFVVATRRNLADVHPINILLLPHFEGTLFINNAAVGGLIGPGGPIDEIFAGKISASQEAAGRDRLAYGFYENMLPTDLKRRGVDDPKVLPNYPYRDDATLVWDAIAKWVDEYTGIYYANDEAVRGDTELAAWAVDLAGSGKIKGFVAITSRAQLVQVLTMVIFTGSAQHAAVNFPQSVFMTYAPAISGAIWGPSNPAGETEAEWLATLAPLKLAKSQLNLLHLLGGVYYRMLGNYQTNDFPYLSWFEDDRVTGKGMALDRFQESLEEVEGKIGDRNNKRIPYEFLLPSKVPMSINI